GFELKPPHNFKFCVLSPGAVLESPGDVLEVARRGEGDMVARARHMSPVKAKLSVV
ncbi:hypothetical protein A2U01_0081240, partial [Trifolium medium]|nr:hypothetical protein [Trifolium medium]